ncbi:MAG: hypothetical protein ACJAXB_000484 [Candidatus Endobugula sp.]|jgi:hypothetical protein
MKIYYELSATIIVPAGPLVKGFTYQLEDYKIIDNDTLLIINCQPIPKLKDKFILSGLLTVRKNDCALLNFKGESTHPFMSKKDPYFKYYEQQNNFKKIEIDYSVNANPQGFKLILHNNK